MVRPNRYLVILQHPSDYYTILGPTVVEGKEAAVALIKQSQLDLPKWCRVPERDLRRAEIPQYFRHYLYCGLVGTPVTLAPPLTPWNLDHLMSVPPTYVLPEPPLFPDLVEVDKWSWRFPTLVTEVTELEPRSSAEPLL